MTCNGAYATAGDFADFFCVEIDNESRQEATINNYLTISATSIHAARAASGGCDCSLATWAEEYLKLLNIVMAAAFYSCPCGRPAVNVLSDDTRNEYRRWVQNELDNIRTQKVELCDGETGADFPVVGWAEQGWNEFARTRIVLNDILRNS